MLHSVKTFVSDRRSGLTKVAGFAGGLYLVRQYIRDRLDEVKERLEEERVSRDNLKRRFEQTQQDVSYTVLALIQTLSDQILEQMDVEGLTQELQTRSKARQASRQQISRPPSSLASSIDVVHQHETSSEAGSAVASLSSSYHVAEVSNENVASTSDISTSGLQSWVESSGSPSQTHTGSAGPPPASEADTTSSVHNGETQSVADSGPTDSALSSSFISESSSSRTTAELWNEVKLLTFTRTLTTLYSTTLLSLFTVIQLTILARSKYIQSVVLKERDERMREKFEAEFSLVNIMLGRGKGLEELLSGDMNALLEDGEELVEGISEEIESKFLTMSWWILHVGWKDIGERVRRGVEEVFDGVSLKSKLAAIDLHRLVSDVRRRVEHEITFEKHERRTNFLSSLLPPTAETVQHVLTQGGFPSKSSYTHLDLLEFDDTSAASSLSQSQHAASSPALGFSNLQSNFSLPTQDAPFSDLLAETHSIITSSDFALVLEVCLDRATDILFSGLEKSVFVSTEPQAAPGEPVRIRLAGLLPGLARWSQLALNGLPNELVDNLLDLREVECLSAIIFSRFEDRFR